MNNAEIKEYPWSKYDFSDARRVFATCPECAWREEVKSTKSTAFFKHYDASHRS
jgi:hypothetical protein